VTRYSPGCVARRSGSDVMDAAAALAKRPLRPGCAEPSAWGVSSHPATSRGLAA
jgi:hypothetical protein